MTDWYELDNEQRLLAAIEQDTFLKNRIRLVNSVNPLTRDDPEMQVRIATTPMPTDQLAVSSMALYGMMASDRTKAKLEAMSPAQQRAVFNQLPPAQQSALVQMQYQVPDVEEEGIFDAVGNVLSVPFRLAAVPLRGLGQVTKPLWSPALRTLSWVADQPAHVYRTIRLMDDNQQWGGLVGAVVGAGAVLAAVPTGGASLASLAALGLLGAGALAGASVGSIVTDPLNPMDFARAWNASRDGERTFDRAAQQYAREILADPRLETLAVQLADMTDRSIYDIAREVAGSREAEGLQQTNRFLAELNRIADTIAQPNTAQHQKVMASLANLLEEPSFIEAVARLQAGKISIGRDVADVLVTGVLGQDRDSALYTFISGGTDLMFNVAVDPFLIAGRAADFAKFRRFGFDPGDREAAITRFLDISENVPSVRRAHDMLAEAVRTNNYELARRIGGNVDALWEPLRVHRANLVREGRALDDFTASDIRSYVVHHDNFQSILSGIGTYRGKNRLMLKGFNQRNQMWYDISTRMRAFTSGLTDVALERRLLEEMADTGDNLLLEAIPAARRPSVINAQEVAFYGTAGNLTPADWRRLANDDYAVYSDNVMAMADRMSISRGFDDDERRVLDDIRTRLLTDQWSSQAPEFDQLMGKFSELAAKYSRMDPVTPTPEWLDELARANDLQPGFRQLGRDVASLAPRLSHSVGTVLQMASTLIPAKKGIQLVGSEAPDEIRRFVEMLRLTSMPEYMRRMWFDSVLRNPTGHQRARAMLSALDNSLTLAGLRSIKNGDEFADRFLVHAQQAYGLGGIDRIVTVNGREIVSSPQLNDAATHLMMPNLTDLRKLTRAGFLGNLIGITDLRVIDAAMNRVWKPAVLLRFAFIPRAGGEEWINFMLRGGFGSIIQNYGGMYAGQYRAWKTVMNKVEELGVRRLGELTPDERMLYERGPLPKFLRPVERMVRRFDDSTPAIKHLNQFAEDLQFFLTPTSMSAFREGREVGAGRGALGFGELVESRLTRIAPARADIRAGAVTEQQVRQQMSRTGRFSRVLPTVEKAKFNAAEYVDSILLGNPASWRRMLAGGVNESTIRAGERFAEKFQTTLMREISATEASNFDRGYERDDVKMYAIPDGTGGTKYVNAVAMRGGWKRHHRANGDPMFNYAAHQSTLNAIVLDEGHRKVATDVLSRVLPPTVSRAEAEALLRAADEVIDPYHQELLLHLWYPENRELLNRTLEGMARRNAVFALVRDLLPETGPITHSDIVDAARRVVDDYTAAIETPQGVKRLWRDGSINPDDKQLSPHQIRLLWRYTSRSTQEEVVAQFAPDSVFELAEVESFLLPDVVTQARTLLDDVAQRRDRLDDSYEWSRQIVNHLWSSPGTLRVERLTPLLEGDLARPIGGVVLAAKTRNLERYQEQANDATKFIGQGAPNTAHDRFAQQFGDRANSGRYDNGDVVMVVADGKRKNRVPWDVTEVDIAIRGRARFITEGPEERALEWNTGQREVADHLAANGYVETEPGRWTHRSMLPGVQFQLYDTLDAAYDDAIRVLEGHFAATTTQEQAALSYLSPEGRNLAEYDTVVAYRTDPNLHLPEQLGEELWRGTITLEDQSAHAEEFLNRLVTVLAQHADGGIQILRHRDDLVRAWSAQMEMRVRREATDIGVTMNDEATFMGNPVAPYTMFGPPQYRQVQGPFQPGQPDDILPDLDIMFADPALVEELNLAMQRLMHKYRMLTPQRTGVRALRVPREVLSSRSVGVQHSSQQALQRRAMTRDDDMMNELRELRETQIEQKVTPVSVVRPVEPGAEQVSMWVADRKFLDERSVARERFQSVNAANDYAVRAFERIKQAASKRAEEAFVPVSSSVTVIAADGTEVERETTRLFRYADDSETLIAVRPGERLYSDTTYVDERGQKVAFGDERFMRGESVTYADNDLMWKLIAPMLEDEFDVVRGAFVYRRKAEMRNVRGRPQPSPDWQRVYRSKETDVPDEAHGGPTVALGPELEVVEENTWDKIVRFGFDRVIGPAIDAIVRRPMAFHFFAQRYKSAEQGLQWILDPELTMRAGQILDRLMGGPGTDAVRRTDLLNLFTEVAVLQGFDAVRWTPAQTGAWVRSYRGEELDDLIARTSDMLVSKIKALDPADTLSQTYRRLNVELQRLKTIYPTEFDLHAATRLADRPAQDALRELMSFVRNPKVVFNPSALRSGYNAALREAYYPFVPRDSLFMTLEDATDVSAFAKHVDHIETQAGEIASQAVFRDVLPFVDSHKVRSQFAEYGKGLLPFWYAEENFLKRWGRTILDDPTVIAKAQLTYMGLQTAGIIRQDEQGRDWFVYPGSGLLVETLSKVLPDAAVASIGTVFQSPTDMMFPGLSERFGTPSFSPFVAVPLSLTTMMFPEVEPIERAVLGDFGASRNAVEHVIPAQLRNLWTGVMAGVFDQVDESNVRYASALTSAMAHLEASGNGVSAYATAAERDEFLRRARQHARVILMAQSLAGWFTPGPPQAAVVGDTAGFAGIGAVDIRNVVNNTYQTLIRDLGIDEGTTRFLAMFPDAGPFDLVETPYGVTNPMALTVGRTASQSGAPLPTTEEALNFYRDHADYMAEFPFAGTWLLPTAKDRDTRVQYAFDQQVIEGLRRSLTPEEFLTELKYKEAAPRYFEMRNQHLEQVARLKASGDQEAVRRQNDYWETVSTMYRAAHPIFAQELTSDEARNRRASVLEEMRFVVNDPGAPPSPALEGLRSLMTEFDAYRIAAATQREDTSQRGRTAVQLIKDRFEQRADAILEQFPEVQSFYLSVVRPEADLD